LGFLISGKYFLYLWRSYSSIRHM